MKRAHDSWKESGIGIGGGKKKKKNDKETDKMIFLISHRCRTMDLMSIARLTRADRVMAEM